MAHPVVRVKMELLRFDGDEHDFGFELRLEGRADAEGLAPGECGTGQLSFWATDYVSLLAAGRKFEVREGTRLVGYGTILEDERERR